MSEKPEHRSYDIETVESPGLSQQHELKFDSPSDATNEGSVEETGPSNRNMDAEWGVQPPKWLTLVRYCGFREFVLFS